MTKHLSSSKARRLTLQGLLAAAAVGAGVAAVVTQMDQGNPVEAAQLEEPQAKELDLLTYSRVKDVRRAAGLENKDLAALGVTGGEATAVLTRLTEWCETNEEAIASARQTINTAKAELREQDRLVRIGQASERQLSDADGKARSLASAEQAHADLLERGAAYAMQSAPGKADAWEEALELKSQVDSELRYVPGMDASRLETVMAEVGRQDAKLEQVLSFSEQRDLEAVRERINTGMASVLVAEALVLPVPEELRGEELFLDSEIKAE